MLILHCTKKLQSFLKISKTSLVDTDTHVEGLGSWHLNIIELDRHLCVIAAHDQTLFNFLIADLPRMNANQFVELFKSYLGCILVEEGFSQDWIAEQMTGFNEVGFSNTNSRQMLGCLNELSFMYSYQIEGEGGVHTPMLPEIIKKLNRVILGPIKGHPIDGVHALYAKARSDQNSTERTQ